MAQLLFQVKAGLPERRQGRPQGFFQPQMAKDGVGIALAGDASFL